MRSGLNIANVNLDIDDNSIREFVKEHVSNEIEDKTIEIVREKKKAVVTIIHSLTPEVIRAAMLRINFSDCKTKFFGKPLYCRPLRELTPEKPSQNKTPQHSSAPKSQETGTKPKDPCKKIPGLPPAAQAKALLRQQARDKKERKETKNNILETADDTQEPNPKETSRDMSAFDMLMKNRHLHLKDKEKENLITPVADPNRPGTVREVAEYHGNMSLGSSPHLKRGSDQLSSPNSPNSQYLNNISKKDKKESELVNSRKHVELVDSNSSP